MNTLYVLRDELLLPVLKGLGWLVMIVLVLGLIGTFMAGMVYLGCKSPAAFMVFLVLALSWVVGTDRI